MVECAIKEKNVIIKKLLSNISTDCGILIEKNGIVVAGVFLNTSKYSSTIVVLLIFVESSYRHQGLYKKCHELITNLGKKLNKSDIYSYIHENNSLMKDIIMEKIGYTPLMQLVTRKI
jgi:V8-like Glu-specific endopeptidase